jgi:hypothetical protein
MLSIFVQLHETSPGSLRGIRKQVQLTLKINNTNPSSYYNDFGAGKSKKKGQEYRTWWLIFFIQQI